MVDWFRMWSRSIIVAVVISTIIEMILPENNSKKYIKILIGMFIVYSIISPMMSKFSGTELDDIIENQEKYLQASSSNLAIYDSKGSINDMSVKSIYSESIKKDMMLKLKSIGYVVEDLNLTIAKDDSYNIEGVNIRIKEKNESTEKQAQSLVETVKYVIIKLDKQKHSESVVNENEKNKIKKVISEDYGVDFSKIDVN